MSMSKNEAISKVKEYLTNYLPKESYSEINEIIYALNNKSQNDFWYEDYKVECARNTQLQKQLSVIDIIINNSKTRNLSNKCKSCPYKDKWGLYDCLNNAFPHLIKQDIYGEGCEIPYEILENIERIRNSIEQEPRKGHWAIKQGVLTGGGDPLLYCPYCKSKESEHMGGVEFPQNWNWCPVCGADMRKVEECKD